MYGGHAGRASVDYEAGTEFVVSALAVRDPIDRFVSGVGEILNRVLNDECPEGPCQENHAPKETMMQSTAWFPVVARAGFNLTKSVLPALMAAFVSDVVCCHWGLYIDHLQPQSTFAQFATRGVDVLLHYESLERDVQKVNYRTDPFEWRSHKEKCTLERMNQGSARPDNVPTASDLRDALDPSLVRQLCSVYSQDYTCFGYELPQVCSAARGTRKRGERPSRGAAPGSSLAGIPVQSSADDAHAGSLLVSAMLLTCNRPAFAVRALRSLASQSFPLEKLEVLLVDDGSLSAHAESLQNAVEDKFALRVVRLKERLSIGAKRNLAVSLAQGEVVIHFDDDDFHHSDRIAAQVGPILRREAGLTTLAYSYALMLGKNLGEILFAANRAPNLRVTQALW